MDGERPAELYDRTREAADALQACAEEVYDLAGPLEKLTEDTAPGTKAALEPARELRQTLEEERAKR